MRAVVGLPYDARDLHDLGIIAVGPMPVPPRNEPQLNVEGQNPGRCRDSPEYFDHGQTHQADVATLIEATVRRYNLAKLTTAFVEMIDGQNTVAEGHGANHERPCIEKRNSGVHQRNRKVRSEVFHNVEAVIRHDVLCHNLEDWDAETNEQINYDRTALVRRSDHHDLCSCDLVEATIDTKRAGRDSDIQRGLEADHNLTVDRVLKDHIVVPYDGVDTLNETTNTNPEHVQTSARVPSFQMPIERDGAENKTNEGKCGVKMVTHFVD